MYILKNEPKKCLQQMNFVDDYVLISVYFVGFSFLYCLCDRDFTVNRFVVNDGNYIKYTIRKLIQLGK